jgi:hypothetical protein
MATLPLPGVLLLCLRLAALRCWPAIMVRVARKQRRLARDADA